MILCLELRGLRRRFRLRSNFPWSQEIVDCGVSPGSAATHSIPIVTLSEHRGLGGLSGCRGTCPPNEIPWRGAN